MLHKVCVFGWGGGWISDFNSLKLNLNPKYRLCLGFRLQLASLHPPSIDHRSLKQNYKVMLNKYVYCLQNNYTKKLVHAVLGLVLQ